MRALVGVMLLCVHVLSCTELVALILAMTAGAAGDHRVLISRSDDSVHVMLRHSQCLPGSASAHCHCLLSRVVVALADQPFGTTEDHVVTLQSHGGNTSVLSEFAFNPDPGNAPLPARVRHICFLEDQIQATPSSFLYTNPGIPCCGIEVCQSTVMLI